MLEKYKGTTGSLFGGTTGSNSGGTTGSTAIDPKINRGDLMNGLFMGAELGNTLYNTNKQLQGSISMLHSLAAPSHAPELSYQTPNYNLLDQQYNNAEAKLNSTPILGTSVAQQIAQQQAIGEKTAALNVERNNAFKQLLQQDMTQRGKIDYQNATQRRLDSEAIRKHDNGIKQTIDSEEGKAIAIKKDAMTKVLSDSQKLWQLQEKRKNMRQLDELNYNYATALDAEIAKEQKKYDAELEERFRRQFDLDKDKIEDIEDFVEKYGIDHTTYDDQSEIYTGDDYKAAYEAFRKENAAEWDAIKKATENKHKSDFMTKYGDLYYSLLKKGGTVKKSSNKSLTAEERIFVDNNKALHDYVKQMNQRETEIFLKLMSI